MGNACKCSSEDATKVDFKSKVISKQKLTRKKVPHQLIKKKSKIYKENPVQYSDQDTEEELPETDIVIDETLNRPPSPPKTERPMKTLVTTSLGSETCSILSPMDAMVSTKLLLLCNLSYSVGIDKPHSKDVAKQSMDQLNLSEVQIWEDADHSVEKNCPVSQLIFRGATAISGLISNLSTNQTSSVMFVAFRGTYDLHDAINDLAAVLPGHLVTAKGTKLGVAGQGYVDHFKTLKRRGLIDNLIALKRKNKVSKLYICGHSLGGGIASLLAAELHVDYPFQFQIEVVTFGSVRCFDHKTASMVTYNFPYRHLRFVNAGDVVPEINDQFSHTGVSCFSPGVHKVSSQFEIRAELDQFNWMPELESPYYSSMLEFEVDSLRNDFSQHRISTQVGYAARLTSSSAFQSAIDSCDIPEVKKTFENVSRMLTTVRN